MISLSLPLTAAKAETNGARFDMWGVDSFESFEKQMGGSDGVVGNEAGL